MKHSFKKYCTEYKNIENYNTAKADNFVGWVCHHRRGEFIPTEELIATGQYYNRPSYELIFLTISEHQSLHKKGEKNPNYGKQLSEETRKRMSEAWDYDKHFTEYSKKKMSEAAKGKSKSDEAKKKMSEAKKGKPSNTKGMRWYHNDVENIMSKECPPGYEPGMLKRK